VHDNQLLLRRNVKVFRDSRVIRFLYKLSASVTHSDHVVDPNSKGKETNNLLALS